jgi:amino acid adenylation domain-containing protein
MSRSIDDILPRDFKPFDRSLIGGSIVARFADTVRQHGSRSAVVTDDGTFSYSMLDAASNCVANTVLNCLGVGSEPVALLYRHGPKYLEAQVGILKAGKCCASLDADLDADRLKALARDLGTRLILCSIELESRALDLAQVLPDCSVFCLERSQVSNHDAVQVDIANDDIAYIIYTSGSTGPPEGVMISHRVALHFAMNQTNSMHIRKDDRCLQICPLSSLASVGEILPMLLNGAALLPWRTKRSGTRRLARWMVERRVTIFTCVPVLFRLLLAHLPEDFTFPDMRMVRLSGDRITRDDCVLFARHFGENCVLRAALGATEANLFSEFYIHRDDLPAGQIVPAGYALPDYEVTVVDEELNRVEAGEVGEIAVKSRYLSEGYWKNEALTAERFRACPGDDDARMYLTRDLGYLDDDGCLMHVGRKDSRVKIYGKMVTISEVEEALLEMPGVREAAVVAVTDKVAETFLIAYYVAEPKSEIGDGEVREWFVARFPSEIVPKQIIPLDALPVTSRNKIDRMRLARSWQDYRPKPGAGSTP